MNFNLDLNDIKYLKIVYLDKNDNTHFIKAAIKQLNDREIFACAKSENETFLYAPQDISLSIVCQNGLYRTTTTLKTFENEDPYIFLYIKTPQELKYEQNREYFRVKISTNISLKFNNEYINCKTFDISASGVKVILPKDIVLPQNNNIELKITFDDTEIITNAKLIRIEKENNNTYASFSFTNISETDSNLISKKCIQKQLQDKRNTLM